MSYGKIASVRDARQLEERFAALGFSIPIDPSPLSAAEDSPLAAAARIGRLTLGNRWAIHPMEGWDANRDGTPSEWTRRRWRRFGESGAKLIWGGEAAAVRPDGRANPQQTLATPSNLAGLRDLRQTLVEAHCQESGSSDGLVVGLQLTHSGRYCRPEEKTVPAPRIAYHHPLLDPRVGIGPADDRPLWTDSQLDDLIGDYVTAAGVADAAGFDFVDVKACHGYLVHELLSARRRPGSYGGDLAGRARFLLRAIRAIRSAFPRLEIGVRLSLFDILPYEQREGVGVPCPWPAGEPYDCGFGCSDANPLAIDLTEPLQLIDWLTAEGVSMLNLSCGSPYYNPHIQRPAIFPPSDGYPPPEDPLAGVARQITAVAAVKAARPELFVVGTGYSYLQEYLPHVAQGVVRGGGVDGVGLGRMVLSYPQLPLDVLAGRPLARKKICRTFSDCTTAPRRGLVSGCYPLDEHYKALGADLRNKVF